MGFGSLLRKGMNLAKSAGKIPGVGMIPGVGNVLSAVGTAASIYGVAKGASSLFGGSSGGGGAGAGLPALPGGMPMIPTTSSIAPGDRSIFRNDPNLSEALKAYAIPKAALRPMYRAPKGFVVLHDQVGDPYGLPKTVAKAMHLWKPAKKPLLSVRDTNAIRHAGRAIKKLQHAEKMARHIANWKSPPKQKFKNIIIEKKGGK